MDKNELINNFRNSLSVKNITVNQVEEHNGYLLFHLDNNQKILTNGKNVYDVEGYEHLIDIFLTQNVPCAVLSTYGYQYLVNLETMEVLFDDKNADVISKQDEETLRIYKHDNSTAIYNIKSQKYLSSPDNYSFESSLGDSLYVFREKRDNTKKDFHALKRCVINANNKILLSDVEGYIYYRDNKLIIIGKDEIKIVTINTDFTYDIKTLRKNETMLTNPEYCNGNIIIVEKNVVKIYNTNLELQKNIEVPDLNEVLKLEYLGDTLQFTLPDTIDGKKTTSNKFVNLKNGKVISHFRIEGYPYWTPTTFVGHDNTNPEFLGCGDYSNEPVDYHFYDHDFNPIIKLQANQCYCADSEKECMFFIKICDDTTTKKKLLNSENGSIKDVDYDYANFSPFIPYGYGVNHEKEKMDFFDENLEVIIPNFDYKKYNLNLNNSNFSYRIVNNYVCIKSTFHSYGKSQTRAIIQKDTGEVILNSLGHKCSVIGNLIQIISENGESEFLNTITGEISPLALMLPTDNTGKIDFARLGNIRDSFRIGEDTTLKLDSTNKPIENAKSELKELHVM